MSRLSISEVWRARVNIEMRIEGGYSRIRPTIECAVIEVKALYIVIRTRH
jgi:hypothetical protein